MELIKKSMLGTKFLDGSADITDITFCFVWKESAWVEFKAQGWGLWANKK